MSSNAAHATIYDLDGRILRDAAPPAARTAATLARRLRRSVVVEDWAHDLRYRMTPRGRRMTAPRLWVPMPEADIGWRRQPHLDPRPNTGRWRAWANSDGRVVLIQPGALPA